MKAGSAFESEIRRILSERIRSLKCIPFAEAAAFPEASSDETTIDGRACNVTTFHQCIDGLHLLTVQVSLNHLLGIDSHWERGLIFVEGAPPREATDTELQNSGG